jgi:heme oxygenase
MLTAHALLREGTADKHEQVDAAFAMFDLTNRQSYIGFLLAHARALGAIELALAAAPAGFPGIRTRLDCLASDLDVLASPWPKAKPVSGQFSNAALFGMLYVAEGSRLGGGVLARRVGGSMPASYLGAVHLKGEWRTLLMMLDAAAIDRAQAWRDDMIDGARRTFDVYMQSAATDGLALV